MKKIWKVLGIAAAVGCIPVLLRTNPETGEKTVDALLWQLKTRPNEETGNKDVELNILPNRFICKLTAEIPDEELIVDEVEEPACDIELTLEPNLDDEPAVEDIEA